MGGSGRSEGRGQSRRGEVGGEVGEDPDVCVPVVSDKERKGKRKEREGGGTTGLQGRFGSGLAQLASNTFFCPDIVLFCFLICFISFAF
jgi:hypothetical protein